MPLLAAKPLPAFAPRPRGTRACGGGVTSTAPRPERTLQHNFQLLAQFQVFLLLVRCRHGRCCGSRVVSLVAGNAGRQSTPTTQRGAADSQSGRAILHWTPALLSLPSRMSSYYDILHVSRDASASELIKAYVLARTAMPVARRVSFELSCFTHDTCLRMRLDWTAQLSQVCAASSS